MPFELAREELETIGRGAEDADLDSVRDAARKAAVVEDHAVFEGYAQIGMGRRPAAAASGVLTISDDYTQYPALVAEAVSNLHGAGVGGPYAIALGPRCYMGLTKTTHNGFPVIDHVRKPSTVPSSGRLHSWARQSSVSAAAISN